VIEVQLALGRRIERLFYFGALLLAALLFLVYLTSAVLFVNAQNPAAFGRFAAMLTEQKTELQDLWDAPAASSDKQDAQRLKKIAKSRASLGLRPLAPTQQVSTQKTYREALAELIAQASKETGLKAEVLVGLVDSQKPPDELIARALKEQARLSSQSITVWGIEAPLMLPVGYGRAEYRVPTTVLAQILLIALAPVVIVWMSSLYSTRQRELLMIRKLERFDLTFPHVLNILRVSFHGTEWARNRQRIKPKERGAERLLAKLATGGLRNLAILLVTAPMLLAFAYSSATFLSAKNEPSFLEVAWLLVAGVWMLLLVIQLLAQEWFLLWDKEFFE